MRTIGSLLVTAIVFFSLVTFVNGQDGTGTAVDNNGKALSDKEQQAFLSSRSPAGQFVGTFSSFGSLLYAVNGIAIHTDSEDIGAVKLGPPYPSDYQATWREVFDSIAIQTKSHWTYDAKRNYWVFSYLRSPALYEIKTADGWKVRDEGVYVGYVPPTYPVGMDIYQLGFYSTDTKAEEPKLFEKIRDQIALQFASNFNKSIAVKDMQTELVDGSSALFFEAVSPIRKEVMWRQWVFVKNGKAFAIVSTLKKDDTNLLDDVKSMIKSVRVK